MDEDPVNGRRLIGGGGYWAYALLTAGAILAETALAHALKISGRGEVALMIAALAGGVYLATPRAEWGEAKRLWGLVAVAFGALMGASLIGVAAGAGVAPSLVPGHAQSHGQIVVLAVALVAAAGVYFGLFKLGHALITQRTAAAPH